MEALFLVDFFKELLVEIDADVEILEILGDPHTLIYLATKTHPYRRSAFQSILTIMGNIGNQTALTYPYKVRLLCECWFDLTRATFDANNTIQDHSDKMHIFDRVFEDERQMWRNHPKTKNAECMLCSEETNEQRKMVHLPCEHTFCVQCCKKWRVNSPVDIRDFHFRYRCPLCRKCMVCGLHDCVEHRLKMPEF